MDKRTILAAIAAELKREKAEIEKNAEAVRTQAVEAPAPMLSKGNRTRYEMNVLHESLRTALADCEEYLKALAAFECPSEPMTAVGAGAVVVIEDAAHQSKTLVLLEEIKNVSVQVGDRPYTAISLRSPLGNALLGKRTGDVISVNGRTLAVISVA